MFSYVQSYSPSEGTEPLKPNSQREGVNPPPTLRTVLSACPCLPFYIAPQESGATKAMLVEN